jgi:hypothetical protein
MMDNASALPHMPTATTTKDSSSKMAKDHPHDFTKRPFNLPARLPLAKKRPRHFRRGLEQFESLEERQFWRRKTKDR